MRGDIQRALAVGMCAVITLGGCVASDDSDAATTIDQPQLESTATPPRPDGTTASEIPITPGPDDAPETEEPTGSARTSEDGISVDEAEAIGALHGDFDALATPHGETTAGTYEFEIRNVGRLYDRYSLAVATRDGAIAVVGPTTLDLAAGATATIEVVVSSGDPSDVELVLVSDGLGGQELIRLPATWSR